MNNLESKINETNSKASIAKKMAKSIGHDVCDAAKIGLMVGGYLISAPIVGNMSDTVREKLYGKKSRSIIREYMTPNLASEGIALLSELSGGVYLLSQGGHNFSDMNVLGYIGAGLLVDFATSIISKAKIDFTNNGEGSSLLGYIPSKITEYLMHKYDDAKKGDSK